jgi:hypothetical protein
MQAPAYKLMASRFQETNEKLHSNELLSRLRALFFGTQLYVFLKKGKSYE